MYTDVCIVHLSKMLSNSEAQEAEKAELAKKEIEIEMEEIRILTI
jgi:hypothetical protein